MNNSLLWKERVKYLWDAELLFDELKIKKKLNRKQKKEIEEKMRKMTYWVWVNSPKIKNNLILKENVIQKCLLDWQSFNCVSKTVSNIQRPNSTKGIV